MQTTGQNFPTFSKNFWNSKFHCHIQHKKCIQMSTNKPSIGAMILELPLELWENSFELQLFLTQILKPSCKALKYVYSIEMNLYYTSGTCANNNIRYCIISIDIALTVHTAISANRIIVMISFLFFFFPHNFYQNLHIYVRYDKNMWNIVLCYLCYMHPQNLL